MPKHPTPFHHNLARLVIWLAIGGILLLALAVVISADGKRLDASERLFTALLPVFSTWVGTVLAYYYTKENFESASRSARELMGVNERLASKAVQYEMIPFGRIVAITSPDDNLGTIDLAELKKKFGEKGSGGTPVTRLHLFDTKNHSLGILHRATWLEMLEQGRAQSINVDSGSLGDVMKLDFPSAAGETFEDLITGSLAFVGRDKTLADAKTAMEAVPGCQDVIVTENGNKTMPVLGWITNVDIAKHSRA